MWATLAHQSMQAQAQTQAQDGHRRKDSAMDEHLAAHALGVLKLDVGSGCRGYDWLEGVDKATAAAISRTLSTIPAVHNPLSDLERQASCSSSDQVPVHIKQHWPSSIQASLSFAAELAAAEAAAAAEEQVEVGNLDCSPERIRNPRERPRRRDIKPSVRRSLLSSFKEVSTPAHSGVSVGTVVPVAGPRSLTAAKTQCILFDWPSLPMYSTDSGSSAGTAQVYPEDSHVGPNEGSFTSANTASTSVMDDSAHDSSVLDMREEAEPRRSSGGLREALAPAVPLSTALAMRSGPLSAAEVQVVALGVASMLLKLHAAGVVHRSVSPDSILVDNPLNISCAFLQQSPLCAPAQIFTRFPDNRLVGNPAFAAPELARSVRGCVPYSFASDMWSLGATVLAMLFPQQPGPFGHRGLAANSRENPGLAASTDELQGWIESKLCAFMNGADSAAPLHLQSLVQMLMRADPGQRASAAYLLTKSWLCEASVQQASFGLLIDPEPETAPLSPKEMTMDAAPACSPTSVHAARLNIHHRSASKCNLHDGTIQGVEVFARERQAGKAQPIARSSSGISCSECLTVFGNGWWDNSKKSEDKQPAPPGFWAGVMGFMFGTGTA